MRNLRDKVLEILLSTPVFTAGETASFSEYMDLDTAEKIAEKICKIIKEINEKPA